MRVFLDANILFSAAKTAGAVRELLRLLRNDGHECCVDDYVVFEARRNLIAKGPQALAALDRLVASCRQFPTQIPDAGVRREEIDWLPEKDRPVLAAAIRLRCDVL
ncbi:MAG TPA: DNA-binding protein, partial [Casimicrobiaceae bacterium]